MDDDKNYVLKFQDKFDRGISDTVGKESTKQTTVSETSLNSIDIHSISDSSEETNILLSESKLRNNMSTDSDETLDPDDNLELFLERSKKNVNTHEHSLSDSDATVDLNPENIPDCRKNSEEIVKSKSIEGKKKMSGFNETKLQCKSNAERSLLNPAGARMESSFESKSPRVQRERNTHLISESESDSEYEIPKQKQALNKKSNKRKSCESDKKQLKRSRYDEESNDPEELCATDVQGHAPQRDNRPPCKYGSKCYRKNPSHLAEFSHSDRDDGNGSRAEKKRQLVNSCTIPSAEVEPSTSKAGTKSGHLSSMSHQDSLSQAQVVSDAGILGFFLTKVSGISPQYNNRLALDIKDLLSPSMGKLKQSAQFNYMTDIPWLIQQYPVQFRDLPLLVVHGCQRREKAGLEREAEPFPNVSLCQARLDIPYGTHHTKMMLLQYDDGFRVVIHTSNLIKQDWFQKTQGIWVSPVFPRMSGEGSTGGDSATYFKRDLLEYIEAYKAQPLYEWINIIKQHDMSSARVHIIGSIPGRHQGDKKSAFGHLKLRKVLQSSGPTKLHAQNWPVIGQFSSIGSLGAKKDLWVCGEWLNSLSTTRSTTSDMGPNRTKLHLIYPTKDDVRLSLEGYPAGASLPYSINVATKQQWLHSLMCKWCSKVRGRTQASPHIKTYTRFSPDGKNLAWFLVTSANLSKAAWGALEKNSMQLFIRSYELGVLFLPENFGTVSSFSVLKNLDEPAVNPDTKQLCFPVPYDVPPTPYAEQDRPWIWDIPYVDKPDTHMNKWCPT